MASSQARTPPKGSIYRSNNKQQSTVPSKHLHETKQSPIDQVYERSSSPYKNGHLSDLQKLKLEIQKDILRSQLQPNNPQNSLMNALTNFCAHPQDTLYRYQSERALQRSKIEEVLRAEEKFLYAERIHQEKMVQLELEEAEIIHKAALLAERQNLVHLSNAEEQNSILRLRFEALSNEHEQEVKDLENKRHLQRQRTKSIIGSEQQKTQLFVRQLHRLTQDLAEKNRQIEKLTRQSIEKEKALQNQRVASEEEVIQAHRLRDQHLESKNKEFHKHEAKIVEENIELKQKNADLELRLSEVSQELASTKHDLLLSQQQVAQLTTDLVTLKRQLADTHANHTEELTKVLEARNKMIAENRRMNKQPEAENHRIIEHYDSTIEQLKKSFERQAGLLKRDILSLRMKIVEKDHELEDIVARYQPLLEAHQTRDSKVQLTESDSVQPNRAQINLLEILTERYRPRVLG